MNKRHLIAVWMVSITLLMTTPVFSGDFVLKCSGCLFNTPPEPQLLYPISDKIVLTGKDFLEFRWWNDFVGIDHFILKIYKGYNMYASGLIYKQDISSDASTIKIKSELFEDGQVYTWSLIQVALGGKKSDKSFTSFKVVKK